MIPSSTKLANRPAMTQGHIAFLDHIRGIAILLVVGFHALGASYGVSQLGWNGLFRDFSIHSATFLALLPLSLGWLGVSIFFVVSGFCIHLSYEKSQPKGFNAFFVRRFFRIYPPYLLGVCFFAFLFPFTMLKQDSALNTAQMLPHLLLIHNFDPHAILGINGSFWSIAVEVQLYLLYPLLAVAAKRFGWSKMLLLTGVVEFSLRGFSGALPLASWCTASPFYYWFSWTIGAKLADDWLSGRRPFLSESPVWVWPALTLLAYFFQPLSEFTFPFVALATANAIACLLSRPAVPVSSPRVWSRFLSWVGVISYSLYLLHEPLLKAVPEALKAAFPQHYFHPLLLFACTLASCAFILPACWLFYRWVELPSMGMGKRLVK